MVYLPSVGLIEQAGFPDVTDLVPVIYLEGVVVGDPPGETGRQSAFVVQGVGVGGLARAGETVKGNDLLAPLLVARPIFKPVLKGLLQATILLNGDRLDLDQEGGRPLAEGDEVSVIQSLAGG